MITKIQALGFAKNTQNTASPLYTRPNYENNRELTSFNPELLKNYFISFTGKNDRDDDAVEYDNVATSIIKKAEALAERYRHPEITHCHIMATAFSDILEYLDKLDNGKGDLFYDKDGNAPSYFATLFSDELYENEDYRKAFKEIVKVYQDAIIGILEEIPKRQFFMKKPTLSDSFHSDMENNRYNLERDLDMVNGYDVYNGAFASISQDFADFNKGFSMKVNNIYMLENPNKDNRLHFSKYDGRAKNVLHNLDFNTNMYITFDEKKVNPNNFVPSIKKIFESENKKSKGNTEIIEFNKNITCTHLLDTLKKLSRNKDKDYIIIFSQTSMNNNSITVDQDGKSIVQISPEYLDFMKKPPKNIHIILFDLKDNYLSYMKSSFTGFYNNFGEISIPVLETKDVIKALQEDPSILKELKNSFQKKALERIVEASSQIEGIFPDKTINLLKKISEYYIDKKEITEKDVNEYLKETEWLFKQDNKSDSVEIVFDTGKRLKDIIGKENTKKEAENIVRQIKNKSIGTKGYIVYAQDGMVGGGRRHTAEAIAGEAKVPFVSINAMDFGTEKVDLFGDITMSPDASMKKLFSLVNTQAEANLNKSVVLFIENFEYFSIGEMVSEYHQKAMAQLLREMENAEKKGLNIVIMGSVSDPDFIGESTMKSFKFNDTLEISTPAYSKKERAEILKFMAKKLNLNIEGGKETQRKLFEDMAKILKYFSFIEIVSFLKTAQTVAQERNHEKITKADMVESFLRITTGRPAVCEDEPFEKEIVTKHECGHAVALQVMNDLLKKNGMQWRIPNMVSFITLDPRGTYGGAVYPKKDINKEEEPFEYFFSDIVFAYGGHSAEKHFYKIDGSLGISWDLQIVSTAAKDMVTRFGQGHNTGKISLIDCYDQDIFGNNMTQKMAQRIEDDIMVITKNALTVSDMIIECYADYINEFADKYAKLVGTGDCLVDGDIFRKEFNEWKAKQPPEKQAEFELVDKMILDAIANAKKGILY